MDGQGNIYVSDADANRIRKIASNGTIRRWLAQELRVSRVTVARRTPRC